MATIKIQRPSKIQEARDAFLSGNYRWIILNGGRGSSKSWGVGDVIIEAMITNTERVLCGRYQKNKTDSSVHQIFINTIKRYGLTQFFRITNTYIRFLPNGSEINYIGLSVNPEEIKSYEGYTIGWIEECNKVPKKTLFDIYPPTVRGQADHGRDPVIFATYNPENSTDPIYSEAKAGKIPRCKSISVNYWDNPFFPPVLLKDMEHCKETDYETYRWLWCGELREYSEEQIFHSKIRIGNLPENPPVEEVYFGADWSNGGQDPHTLIRCYIVNNVLYIDRAVFSNCDIDQLPEMWRMVEGSKDHVIRADSSHGDAVKGNGTNKYMRKHGFNCKTPKKLEVKTGILYLRQFKEIVIDYTLKEMIEEAYNYKWKVDKASGDILPIPVDKYNHGWDAVRYALQPLIARGRRYV